jgi:hypothetical protein
MQVFNESARDHSPLPTRLVPLSYPVLAASFSGLMFPPSVILTLIFSLASSFLYLSFLASSIRGYNRHNRIRIKERKSRFFLVV